jgi:WD40 repeat protein
MSSLKADPAQIHRIKQARIDLPAAIDNPKWLLEASCCDNRTLKLWDLDRQQCLHTFGGHTREIRAPTFIPPSATTPELLSSAGDDLRIGLWNTRTGECVGILEGHDRRIWSLCYSHDLQLLYSCKS